MEKFKLAIPEWIIKRWCIISYLIINWRIKELVEKIQVEPGMEFYKVASKYLSDYVYNDTMPPDEIAPTILNLAEDFMAGKPVNFRVGDYIAIQNYIRQGKK